MVSDLQKRRPSGRFIVILMTFILIGLWFYWFQYRSAEIRRECAKYASENIKTGDGGKVDIDKFIKANDFVYQECLKMRGFE